MGVNEGNSSVKAFGTWWKGTEERHRRDDKEAGGWGKTDAGRMVLAVLRLRRSCKRPCRRRGALS